MYGLEQEGESGYGPTIFQWLSMTMNSLSWHQIIYADDPHRHMCVGSCMFAIFLSFEHYMQVA